MSFQRIKEEGEKNQQIINALNWILVKNRPKKGCDE